MSLIPGGQECPHYDGVPSYGGPCWTCQGRDDRCPMSAGALAAAGGDTSPEMGKDGEMITGISEEPVADNDEDFIIDGGEITDPDDAGLHSADPERAADAFADSVSLDEPDERDPGVTDRMATSWSEEQAAALAARARGDRLALDAVPGAPIEPSEELAEEVGLGENPYGTDDFDCGS